MRIFATTGSRSFTQVDMELSFVNRETVMEIIEGLIKAIVKGDDRSNVFFAISAYEL